MWLTCCVRVYHPLCTQSRKNLAPSRAQCLCVFGAMQASYMCGLTVVIKEELQNVFARNMLRACRTLTNDLKKILMSQVVQVFLYQASWLCLNKKKRKDVYVSWRRCPHVYVWPKSVKKKYEPKNHLTKIENIVVSDLTSDPSPSTGSHFSRLPRSMSIVL